MDAMYMHRIVESVKYNGLQKTQRRTMRNRAGENQDFPNPVYIHDNGGKTAAATALNIPKHCGERGYQILLISWPNKPQFNASYEIPTMSCTGDFPDIATITIYRVGIPRYT